MNEQPVVIQRVSWSELCPWLIIFKSLSSACSISVLALALMAVLLTPMGWRISEALFINQENLAALTSKEKRLAHDELMTVVRINNSPYRGVFPVVKQESTPINFFGSHLRGPRLVFQKMAGSFKVLFDGSRSPNEFYYFFFGSLWSLAVWSFAGLGITRICLLKLTRNENAGLDDGFEFAWDHWLTAVSAIGIPLITVGAMCIPTFLIGLLMGF